MSMDMNKMLQQAQQMQAQMQKAQEEMVNETVEATAGGGMVTVEATGAGEITRDQIDPKAIDPDDPEMLEDMVLAAVNEALRSAQSLMESSSAPRSAASGPRPAGAVVATAPRAATDPVFAERATPSSSVAEATRSRCPPARSWFSRG